MDYSLMLRSSTPPSPTLFPHSSSITNMISTRITTKLSPNYHHLYMATLNVTSSKWNNVITSPTKSSLFATNYYSSRAQFLGHVKSSSPSSTTTEKCDADHDHGSAIAVMRTITLTFVLCAFSFGAALMISPHRAIAAALRGGWNLPRSMSSDSGAAAENLRRDKPTSPKDILISLSNVKRYFLAPEELTLFGDPKQKALKEIKNKGKDIEKALGEMNKALGMRGNSVGEYDIKLEAVEILIAQGKFVKALETLKSIQENFIPHDRRPRLYQAIIYSILYDKNNPPEKYWEEFFKDDGFPTERPDSKA